MDKRSAIDAISRSFGVSLMRRRRLVRLTFPLASQSSRSSHKKRRRNQAETSDGTLPHRLPPSGDRRRPLSSFPYKDQVCALAPSS